MIKKNRAYRKRQIGEKCFLVSRGSCFELNETAEFLFDCVDGKRTIDEISAALTTDYQISLEEASRDAIAVFDHLIDIGALIVE